MTPQEIEKLNEAIKSILTEPGEVTEHLADSLHACHDFEYLVKGCVVGAIELAGYKFDLHDLPEMDHPYVLTLRNLMAIQSSAIHAGIKIGHAAAKAGLELP
jgi:hypothetical protein